MIKGISSDVRRENEKLHDQTHHNKIQPGKSEHIGAGLKPGRKQGEVENLD